MPVSHRRTASAAVALAHAVLVASLLVVLAPGPARGVTSDLSLSDAPIVWSGTIDADVEAWDVDDFAVSGTYAWSNLKRGGSGSDLSMYTADRETFGSSTHFQEWCDSTGTRQSVTYSFDDFPGSVHTVRLAAGEAPNTLVIHLPSFAVGATRFSECPSNGDQTLVLANPLIHVAEASTGPQTFAAEAPRLNGSETIEWAAEDGSEGYKIDIDFDLTGKYDLTCGGGSGDLDGDRLPDGYESEVTSTDPESCDTDKDGFRDALEVASGSHPLDPGETPNTLPAGAAASSVAGTGDVGVTCGRSRFAWVSPTLRPLGVPMGAKSCIWLLSNETARGLVATAFATDTETLTGAITDYLRPHLGEVNGHTTVDWTQEAEQHDTAWASRLVVKRALARSLNFTRLNAAFAVGKLAALSGVALGSLWKLNQIENRGACIQVRIGTSAQGANLSWSLVYSVDQLTATGVREGLHRAGVWKKKERFGPDTAVRRHVNLRCDGGHVVASGSADSVFEGAKSLVN